MEQLIKNIEQWAEERNLIQDSKLQKQMLELYEEFGKLCTGVICNNPKMIKNTIGNCFVALTILNAQYRKKRNGNGFEPATLIPRGCFAHNNINEAVLDLADYLSNCYMGKYLPQEVDINVGASALENVAKHAKLNFKECIQCAYYNLIMDRSW